jgi:hypothetical protein
LRLSPQEAYGKEIVVYMISTSTIGAGADTHEFRPRRRAFHEGIEQLHDLLVAAWISLVGFDA